MSLVLLVRQKNMGVQDKKECIGWTGNKESIIITRYN